MNDYEYGILEKKTGLDQDELLARVPTIIVTKGEDGADIITRDEVIQIPIAKPAVVLEPTGVGDAFRAGLLKGLAHGYDWPVTGRIAALAAAYVLEHPGPQPKPYTLRDFVARYRENFGDAPELDDLLGG